ncbi:MAG: MarR family transcriptional regulator [Actinomycetota bacterium]
MLTVISRTAPDGAVAARLRLAVMRLARRLRRQATTDATPSMLSALSTLEHSGPLTLGDLAAIEGVRPPSMTRIVARLEEDALVARVADRDDRRVARVSLTPAGGHLIRQNRTRKDAYLARRLGALDARDRALLARAIPVIERLLDEDER